MMTSKAVFIRKSAAISLLLLSYLFATIYKSTFVTDILSPLNAFAAGAILLFVWIKADDKGSISMLSYLFLTVAALLWGIADTIWAVFDFIGKEPLYSTLISIIYVLSNFSIMMAVLMTVVKQFGKWNTIQLGLDIFFISIMSLFIIWITYLRRDWHSLQALLEIDTTSLFSVGTDFIIAIGIIIFVFSVRSGKIPGFLGCISAGMLLFTVVDLVYYYLLMNDLYAPSSLIDCGYIVALQLMAFGGLLKVYKSPADWRLSVLSNTGWKLRYIFLLLFPAIALTYKFTSITGRSVDYMDVGLLFFLIILYRVSCRYVQVSLENEKLLNKEKDKNADLQHRLDRSAATELIFKTVMDPILLLDKDGIIRLCNHATAALFKYDIDFLTGKSLEQFLSPDYKSLDIQKRLNHQSYLINVDIDFVDAGDCIINTIASFSVAYEDTGDILGYIVNIHDVTEAKKVYSMLDNLSNYDPLTGLPNRRLFFSRLVDMVESHKRHGHRFAVLFLDLDGFKKINDAYGHDTGDQLLEAVGKQLLSVIRKNDVAARIGGDEFVILFESVETHYDITDICSRIKNIFSRAFILDNHKCSVGISIGVSLCPEDGITTNQLIKLADERMYADKAMKKQGKTYKNDGAATG